MADTSGSGESNTTGVTEKVVYVAECSCGWAGTFQQSKIEAGIDYERHVQYGHADSVMGNPFGSGVVVFKGRSQEGGGQRSLRDVQPPSSRRCQRALRGL